MKISLLLYYYVADWKGFESLYILPSQKTLSDKYPHIVAMCCTYIKNNTPVNTENYRIYAIFV